MEYLDFSSVITTIRNYISDAHSMNQIDMMYQLFVSFLSSDESLDFDFDNGLVCRWFNGQAKISPRITRYYMDNHNRNRLAADMHRNVLPLMYDSTMAVQEIYNILVQDTTISDKTKARLLENYPCETEMDEAVFLTSALCFGMERTFVKRDVNTKNLLSAGNLSPAVKDFIYDGGTPKPCRHFCGRDNELVTLHQLLCSHGKVFLQGIAGIGKSELAKAYAKIHSKEYTNILYLSYTGNLKQDISDMDFADDLPDDDNEERFRKHNRFLRTLKEDTLFIIDNFNTKKAFEEYDQKRRIKIPKGEIDSAAYASCSRLYNDYDGLTHDYTRKHWCLYSEVFLPQYAPEEWKDRQLLWEAVESVEKTKDSRLARELVVALPSELSLDDWKSMLKRFVREQGIDLGMCADVNIHDPYPPGHNPHSHILFTMRPLDEHGKWQTKTQKEYLCKRGGEERGFTADEFKTAKTQGWEKQYMYQFGEKRQYLTPSEAEKIEGCIRTSKTPKSTRYGRQNPLTALWNSEEQIFAWRKSWEMIVNEEQERHGIADRVDCRSHAARGLTEQPTVHEGYHARKLESMGIVSDRCELNRQIRADNKLLRELKKQVQKLMKAVKENIPALASALETLRDNMIFLQYTVLLLSMKPTGRLMPN